jgi:translation initiation factor IF-3
MQENKINEQIYHRSGIYLIDSNSGQMALTSTHIALNQARTEALDLVQISVKEDGIPICKIIDYGKFRYELTKKQQAAKKQQPKNVTKEIRLTPRIEKHDIDIKINQVKKFLDENYKVQVSVYFKGRENHHKDIGLKILENFKLPEANIAYPRNEGNSVSIVLTKVQ